MHSNHTYQPSSHASGFFSTRSNRIFPLSGASVIASSSLATPDVVETSASTELSLLAEPSIEYSYSYSSAQYLVSRDDSESADSDCIEEDMLDGEQDLDALVQRYFPRTKREAWEEKSYPPLLKFYFQSSYSFSAFSVVNVKLYELSLQYYGESKTFTLTENKTDEGFIRYTLAPNFCLLANPLVSAIDVDSSPEHSVEGRSTPVSAVNPSRASRNYSFTRFPSEPVELSVVKRTGDIFVIAPASFGGPKPIFDEANPDFDPTPVFRIGLPGSHYFLNNKGPYVYLAGTVEYLEPTSVRGKTAKPIRLTNASGGFHGSITQTNTHENIYTLFHAMTPSLPPSVYTEFQPPRTMSPSALQR